MPSLRHSALQFVSAFAAFTLGLIGPLAANDDVLALTDDDYSPQYTANLIELLDKDSADLRIDSVQTLQKDGVEAKAAIPKLIELLSDTRSRRGQIEPISVSGEAIQALVIIGSEAVGPLSRAYEECPPSVQERIEQIARQIGPNARALLPQFVRSYQTADKQRRRSLVSAIAAIDPDGKTALPMLLEALRADNDEWVRRTAAEYLTCSDHRDVYWQERAPMTRWLRDSSVEPKPVVEALLAALDDSSEEVRGPAAKSLAMYPEAAARAVPKLIKLLEDDQSYSIAYSNHAFGYEAIADAAAEGLARFPAQADQSLPALVKAISGKHTPHAWIFDELIPHAMRPLEFLSQLLDSPHPDLALGAIVHLGEKARTAIPKVKDLTKHEEERIADQAHLTLACLDREAHPESFDRLKDLLTLDREQTAAFLEAAGPAAAFTVPLLIPHMQEQGDLAIDGELDQDVMRALKTIGPTPAVAAVIIDHLDTGFSFYRDDNEDVLVTAGPKVVPLLIEALNDPKKSPVHRISCLTVLNRFGSKAETAVPGVAAQIDSKYPHVRKAAALALGAIASQPDVSVPALKKLLSDPRPMVRAAAARSCGAFQAAAEPLIGELIGRLSDEYLDVKVSAAAALGRLGKTATSAVPSLKSLADDENVLLSDTAREALAAIDNSGQR